MIRHDVKERLRLLIRPETTYRQTYAKKTLEEVVNEYLRLLITAGVVAALLSLVISVIRAAYYDVFLNATIKYWNLLNYQVGLSTGILFFYIFTGTFILFIISLIMNAFTRMKYSQLIKTLLIAVTPLILFGWLPVSRIPLIIWSAFLFTMLVREEKKRKIRRTSIEQRD